MISRRSATHSNPPGGATALGLTEFGACGTFPEEAELSRAKECDVELARIPRVGYPGPTASLPVTLCTSYRDSAGDLREVEPDLLRHAAVHVFGHVLGWDDDLYDPLGGRIMMQGIDLDSYRGLFFGDYEISWVQYVHGVTPRVRS